MLSLALTYCGAIRTILLLEKLGTVCSRAESATLKAAWKALGNSVHLQQKRGVET